MTPPDRLRGLLAEPGFVVMPAVWDGLTCQTLGSGRFQNRLPFRLLRGSKPPGRSPTSI